MTVVLQLHQDAARALRERLLPRAHAPGPAEARRPHTGSASPSPAARVLALVDEAHATVVPVDPRAADPHLSTFFTIHVPSPEAAARLAFELLGMPSVEAAYVKPSDESPA